MSAAISLIDAPSLAIVRKLHVRDGRARISGDRPSKLRTDDSKRRHGPRPRNLANGPRSRERDDGGAQIASPRVSAQKRKLEMPNMTIFGRLPGYRAKRERELKNEAAVVVSSVTGTAANAWWVPVGNDRPVLIPVLIAEESRCREVANALHAEWQRSRSSSRELDFIVLAADNAQAVTLIVNAATPLMTPAVGWSAQSTP